MTVAAGIKYQMELPEEALSQYVKCFWCVSNTADREEKFKILPDGHFDVIFRLGQEGAFSVSLTGLSTKEFECIVPGNSSFLAVSFKLLALDYLMKTKISSFVDGEIKLENGFWDIEGNDLSDFSQLFVKKMSKKMLEQLPLTAIDQRKQQLFDGLYASNGAIKVREIAEQVNWSSRQINRYFESRVGISLKAYCTILRYRASFDHLKKKQLSPEQDYSDQAHFIKEVKKFSKATPKELAKNENDRFIQLSTLKPK